MSRSVVPRVGRRFESARARRSRRERSALACFRRDDRVDADPRARGVAEAALAAQIAAEKNVTVHVIGFKVRAQHFQWNGQGAKNRETSARCLADQTGGKYVSTESTEKLVKALQYMLSCSMVADDAWRELADPQG